MFEAEYTHEGDHCTLRGIAEALLPLGGAGALRADRRDRPRHRSQGRQIRAARRPSGSDRLVAGIAMALQRTTWNGSRAAPRCSTASTNTSRKGAASRECRRVDEAIGVNCHAASSSFGDRGRSLRPARHCLRSDRDRRSARREILPTRASSSCPPAIVRRTRSTSGGRPCPARARSSCTAFMAIRSAEAWLPRCARPGSPPATWKAVSPAGSPAPAARSIAGPSRGPSKWITRERPKIDRIACPWLIGASSTADAFLFVPGRRVLAMAGEIGAIPYDIPAPNYP